MSTDVTEGFGAQTKQLAVLHPFYHGDAFCQERNNTLDTMSAKKPRIAVSKGFQGPARSGFGGFTTASSSLSYISEPPDFGTIADPNVVVSLKNLLKKDSTTKAKALDDLLVYVQEQPFEKNGGVEEPILDAWVRLPFANDVTRIWEGWLLM